MASRICFLVAGVLLLGWAGWPSLPPNQGAPRSPASHPSALDREVLTRTKTREDSGATSIASPLAPVDPSRARGTGVLAEQVRIPGADADDLARFGRSEGLALTLDQPLPTSAQLQRLRGIVRASGHTSAELQRAANELTQGESGHTAVVLGMAWAEDPTVETDLWLTAALDPGPSWTDARLRFALASLASLQLGDRRDALDRYAADSANALMGSLSGQAELTPDVQLLRLALEGMDGTPDDLEDLASALVEHGGGLAGGFAPQLVALEARSSRSASSVMLRHSWDTCGQWTGSFAIEHATHPELESSLSALVLVPHSSQYEQELAAEALVALAGSGSSASMDVVLECAAGSAQARASALGALRTWHRSIHQADAAARCATLPTRVPGDAELSEAAATGIERCIARVRFQREPRERLRLRQTLQEVANGLAPGDPWRARLLAWATELR